ncbi:hypothetical protein BJX61DRAFT_501662 [Aspergillus egyptiacus]|nr:hypothetical protein BJX61DRAFT_501662 [Aspergillus egyptiacus]
MEHIAFVLHGPGFTASGCLCMTRTIIMALSGLSETRSYESIRFFYASLICIATVHCGYIPTLIPMEWHSVPWRLSSQSPAQVPISSCRRVHGSRWDRKSRTYEASTSRTI